MRFGTRGLLIAVLFCALLCAPLAQRIQQARRQRGHVAEIVAGGGIVMYEFHENGQANTRRIPAPPAGVGQFKEPSQSWLRTILGGDFFDRVRNVGFDQDSGELPIESLQQLKDLRYLMVRHRPISATEFDGLKRLNQLAVLDLMGTTLTREQYDQLREALPECELIVDLDIFEPDR